MQNPIRGLLHGSAAFAGIVGALFLTIRAPTWPSRAAVFIFGIAIVALYTTSSLYHSVPWSGVWNKRMQRLDHSMIYVLIAGTYTPVIVIALDAPLRWIALGVAWGIAAFGVGQKAFLPDASKSLSIALSTTMGWLGIFIMWPVIERLGWPSLLLAGAGGILYTVGMVFVVTNRPRLWPRVFSYHELFHVFVVSATSLHFLMIWRYVVPVAS